MITSPNVGLGEVYTASPENTNLDSSFLFNGTGTPQRVPEECNLSLETQRAVGGAITQLGLKLLVNLQPGTEQPNVVLSPLSISLALSQLALGARNETEKQLLGALHAALLSDYYKTLSCLQEQLIVKAVKVASRIYLKPGEWKSRFDARFTTKDLFYIDRQTSVKVDMMMGSKHPLSMFVDGEQGIQVARFPFQKNISFLVVMPMQSENLSRAAANLNISELYRRLPNEIPMLVKLPKFKLEYKQDLQQALTSMGLGALFSGPNLSGIAEGPLVVSGVQHASSIELNEEGAQASAATSVTLVRTIPIFAVNMPFIFAIVDDVSHAPLFLGTVTNPNPGATAELSDDPEILRFLSSNMPSDKPQNDDPYWDNMLHDESQ
ncbi:alpha-2-antiplasmin [Silurus meridionalis]|nr:alpha-2-antiplasmin [Silurus meridionalis]